MQYPLWPTGQRVFYTTGRARNPYYARRDAKYMDQTRAILSRYHAGKKTGVTGGIAGLPTINTLKTHSVRMIQPDRR